MARKGRLRGRGSHDVVVTDQEISGDYLMSTTVPTGPTEMKGAFDHVAINANLLAGFARSEAALCARNGANASHPKSTRQKST